MAGSIMEYLAFCSDNAGGGTSTLVFHIAHALADLGRRALLVDLDPQSSLTAMCVPEQRLEELWPDDSEHPCTIAGALTLAAEPHVEPLRDGLGLVAGDFQLARWEGPLSTAWTHAPASDRSAPNAIATLVGMMLHAARLFAADVVLVEVGPGLGAINRTALTVADHVVIPLAPDPFGLQGLRALGPTLATWRMSQATWPCEAPLAGLASFFRRAEPLGYVVMQTAMHLRRPVSAHERWMRRIPDAYHRFMVGGSSIPASIDEDPHCLGTMRHHDGLALLARDAKLAPDDLGGSGRAV